jgi:hypothetical protein
MEPAKQHYSEKEEDKILFSIYSMGSITLQEFLEFSNFSFSKKLLRRVEERDTSLLHKSFDCELSATDLIKLDRLVYRTGIDIEKKFGDAGVGFFAQRIFEITNCILRKNINPSNPQTADSKSDINEDGLYDEMIDRPNTNPDAIRESIITEIDAQ